MSTLSESDLVFNVIFTPGTFQYLQFFTRSLLRHSRVTFRLVPNGCGTDELRLMEEFLREHDEGVLEVFPLSAKRMVAHGAALNEIYEARDDGDHFCFIDSDMKANGPFMNEFVSLSSRYAAVTSGRPMFSDDSVIDSDTAAYGLAGMHFFGEDGFVYGSSYMAIYARRAVDQTRDRWKISYSPYRWRQLPEEVRAVLTSLRRTFGLYDTAKVLNILLQADGHEVHHFEHPNLVHIGGMSEYLSRPRTQPRTQRRGDGESLQEKGAPRIARQRGFFRFGPGERRWDVAGFAATTLQSLIEGDAPPDLPTELDPETQHRFDAIKREVVGLVTTYLR